jgi:ankyrin repeat protein
MVLLALALITAAPAQADPSSDRGLAQAIEAGDETAARHWLDHGANPEYRGADPFGSPLLLRALLDGKPRLVRLLLERGADPSARDRRGTPVLVSASAMAQGQRARAVTAAIAELFRDSRRAPDPDRCLDRADIGDDRSALHAAASVGNLELVRLLIQRGADPNLANRFGETPLFFAAEHGHRSVAQELVSRGASLHRRSRYTGMTPLGLAAEGGHVETVSLLLEHRANPASRNAFGKTPVDLARQASARNPAAAQALVSLENAWMRQTFRSTLEWVENPTPSSLGVSGGPAGHRPGL